MGHLSKIDRQGDVFSSVVLTFHSMKRSLIWFLRFKLRTLFLWMIVVEKLRELDLPLSEMTLDELFVLQKPLDMAINVGDLAFIEPEPERLLPRVSALTSGPAIGVDTLNLRSCRNVRAAHLTSFLELDRLYLIQTTLAANTLGGLPKPSSGGILPPMFWD